MRSAAVTSRLVKGEASTTYTPQLVGVVKEYLAPVFPGISLVILAVDGLLCTCSITKESIVSYAAAQIIVVAVPLAYPIAMYFY